MADGRIFRAISAFLGKTGIVPLHLNVPVTPVGNVGAGEDDLLVNTIEAGSISKQGSGFKLTAWGTKANNADVKTLRVRIGGQIALTANLVANESGAWKVEVVFVNHNPGATAQQSIATVLDVGNAQFSQQTSFGAVIDPANSIEVKLTANAVTTDNIRQFGQVIEKIGS